MFKNQILRNLLDRKSSTCWFLSRNENNEVLYRIFQNMSTSKTIFSWKNIFSYTDLKYTFHLKKFAI